MSYKAIIKAINSKLKDEFNIPVISVDEKLIRPSFMVDLDSVGSGDFMGVAKDKKMTARLQYFSTKRDGNKIENLDMMDSLEDLFLGSVIEVEDIFNLDVMDIDIEIIDKVLHCSFDIEFNELYETTDDVELMEELEIGGIDG